MAITQREDLQTLAEFWPLSGFFFDGPADDPACARSGSDPRRRGPCWRGRAAALDAIEGPWTVGAVEAALRAVLDREGVKPGKLYQPLRVALAGTTVSPGIFETVALLGRDETLARLNGGTSGLNRPSTDADRG